MESISEYIKRRFGVDDHKFIEVMKMSPGAEGYVHGSLSELLFKDYIESKGFDAYRIKEKPEGGYNAKNDDARGDFYIKKKDYPKDEWYVIENKGIKTNTEKHLYTLDTKDKLYNHLKSLAFPKENYLEKTFEKGLNKYKKAKEKWEAENVGKNFLDFKWDKKTPGSRSFNLIGYWKDKKDLREWVDKLDDKTLTTEAYLNLRGPIKMLTTHAPSNRVAPYTGIKQAAPLVTEFNIMCVDLFQRIGKHKFVFMNPKNISHSPTSPEHLYQNYHIDYIIPGIKNELRLQHPWYDDIEECIKQTKPIPRKIDMSQLDLR